VRAGNQCPGNVDPLLLAPAEGGWAGVPQFLRNAQPLQVFPGQGAGFCKRPALPEQPFGHDVHRRHPGHHPQELGNVPYFPVPQAQHQPVGSRRQVHLPASRRAVQNVASGGKVGAIDALDHRGLPRPAGAGDSNELSFPQAEADTQAAGNFPAPQGVQCKVFDQVFNL